MDIINEFSNMTKFVNCDCLLTITGHDKEYIMYAGTTTANTSSDASYLDAFSRARVVDAFARIAIDAIRYTHDFYNVDLSEYLTLFNDAADELALYIEEKVKRARKMRPVSLFPSTYKGEFDCGGLKCNMYVYVGDAGEIYEALQKTIKHQFQLNYI